VGRQKHHDRSVTELSYSILIVPQLSSVIILSLQFGIENLATLCHETFKFFIKLELQLNNLSYFFLRNITCALPAGRQQYATLTVYYLKINIIH